MVSDQGNIRQYFPATGDVIPNGLLQEKNVGKFTIITYPFDKIDPQSAAVKVSIEIKQMDLHRFACTIEGRIVADIAGTVANPAIALDLDGIDTGLRQQLLFHLDIRRGKTKLLATVETMNNLASNGKVAAQERYDPADITGGNQLANHTAAETGFTVANLLKNFDREAKLPSQSSKKADISLAIPTKDVIETDHETFHTNTPDQDVPHEMLRGKSGKLPGKGHTYQDINPRLSNELFLLGIGSNQPEIPFRRQDLQRMRCKGDDHRNAAPFRGRLADLFEYRAVAEMHAIEVANRHDGMDKAGRDLLNCTVNMHVTPVRSG